MQKISEGALRKCPACGALKMHRKVSLSAFHLKGAGWYVTDYGPNGKEKSKEEKKSGDAEAKPATGSDSEKGTKDSEKKETKDSEKGTKDSEKKETKEKPAKEKSKSDSESK